MAGYAGSVSATLERLRPDIFMSHFLRDILRQPNELQRTLDHLSGAGRAALDAAVTAGRPPPPRYFTGVWGRLPAGGNGFAGFSLLGRPGVFVRAPGRGASPPRLG